MNKKAPQFGNFQRLIVHLFNPEHKKEFKTTHVYYDVHDEREAIRVIWAMHSEVTDNNHDMSRKIVKATYNGKPITAFAKPTDDRWLIN